MPDHVSARFARVRDATERLIHSRLNEPGVPETAAAAGLSIEQTDHVLRSQRPALSLDDSATEQRGSSLAEQLADRREDRPWAETDKSLLKSRLNEVLKGLTRRDREIIRLRYGLGKSHAHTLDQVGKAFAISRERVRQIETPPCASCSNRCRRPDWWISCRPVPVRRVPPHAATASFPAITSSAAPALPWALRRPGGFCPPRISKTVTVMRSSITRRSPILRDKTSMTGPP